jgi:hypothetical protein
LFRASLSNFAWAALLYSDLEEATPKNRRELKETKVKKARANPTSLQSSNKLRRK